MTTKQGAVEKIKHLIRGNFSSQLPLDQLAEQANLSPFHFQRVFKEQTGESPKQYLLRVRLEAAAHVLMSFPNQNMLSVALDCGFNSLEHFSRSFKNASPQQVAKRCIWAVLLQRFVNSCTQLYHHLFLQTCHLQVGLKNFEF